MANDTTETAYTHIRNKILLGEYALGSALRTNRLSDEIGVSRTPIRDALRLLETEGLVVIRPRLGAQVVSLTMEEFAHLCSMRLALEMYGAGLAATNRTPEDVTEMKNAIQGMVSSAEKFGPKASPLHFHEFQRFDLQFHMVILSAAKNPVIKHECTRIHLLDHLVSGKLMHSSAPTQDGPAEAIRDHRAILETIERGNVTDARTAMERHLQPVVDRCLAAFGHESSFREATLKRIQMIDTASRS